MKPVWVTGASGFIGRNLARRLSKLGFDVAGIGLGPFPTGDAATWGLSTWTESAIESHCLDRLAERTGMPDAVFHLAGGSSVGASVVDPLRDFHSSVTTTETVLEWLRQSAPSARLVLASSAAVYGTGHRGPIPDDGQIAPCSPYGYHKRMAEMLCEAYVQNFGAQCAVLRLFSVYGAGLEKQLLWDLCQRLKGGPDGIVLAGTGRELRDWVHADVAVEMLVRALDVPAPFAVHNGGTGRGTDVATVAGLVVQHWGGTARVSFNGEVRAGDPLALVADPTTASAAGLGPDLADGVREYVDWFRRTGR
jgi:UDP-glucose 4-epimerase